MQGTADNLSSLAELGVGTYTALTDPGAAQRGQDPNASYADEGFSGTSTKNRSEFNRMIQDCKEDKIDRILVKFISRFSRNTLDCIRFVRELKELGVGITFEKENIDSLDAKGEVLLTILSSLAQDESRFISENATRGIRK